MTTKLFEAITFGIDTASKESFSPDIINNFVLALSYTFAMCAAALKMEKASYQLQGATLGKMAIDPACLGEGRTVIAPHPAALVNDPLINVPECNVRWSRELTCCVGWWGRGFSDPELPRANLS